MSGVDERDPPLGTEPEPRTSRGADRALPAGFSDTDDEAAPGGPAPAGRRTGRVPLVDQTPIDERETRASRRRRLRRRRRTGIRATPSTG